MQASKEQAVSSAPVLHGAAPNFKHVSGGVSAAAGAAATKAGSETTGNAAAGTAETSTAAPTSSTASSSSTTAKVAPAGPPATKVAHRFSGAFVLYETGQNNQAVRTAFATTATPQLTHQLLRQSRVAQRRGQGLSDEVAGEIWRRRFYDFNVWTERKRIEKLRYMHRNPVKRIRWSNRSSGSGAVFELT